MSSFKRGKVLVLTFEVFESFLALLEGVFLPELCLRFFLPF